jgi:hypothetical protein
MSSSIQAIQLQFYMNLSLTPWYMSGNDVKICGACPSWRGSWHSDKVKVIIMKNIITLSDVYHNSENKNLKTFYVILARRTIL